MISSAVFLCLIAEVTFKQKKLQTPDIHIYVVTYLGTKNIHIKYKKIQPKNNRKIKIKTNQRKK